MSEPKIEKIDRNKYAVGFHFIVSFSGVPDIEETVNLSFMSVSGLETEISTEEVIEGGLNNYVYRLPKQVKYNNLVLKRALNLAASSHALIKWAEAAIQNFEFKLSKVTVALLNESHDPIKTWTFHDAYPVKLNVSNLEANKNELVIESLELAYKYFTTKIENR